MKKKNNFRFKIAFVGVGYLCLRYFVRFCTKVYFSVLNEFKKKKRNDYLEEKREREYVNILLHTDCIRDM